MSDVTTPWLTTHEAAAIARCSEKVIRRAVRQRRLRAATIDARGTLRIHASWLHAWLEQLAEPIPSEQGDEKRFAANDQVPPLRIANR